MCPSGKAKEDVDECECECGSEHDIGKPKYPTYDTTQHSWKACLQNYAKFMNAFWISKIV